MEPRDPKVYDRLKIRRDDISVEDLPSHVSYMCYNTERNEITDIRVSDSVRLVVDAIKNCLEKK